MEAIINTKNFQVAINGQTFQARHVNHTYGPAMYFGTPDRTFDAPIDLAQYKVDPKQAELDALIRAVIRRGFEAKLFE